MMRPGLKRVAKAAFVVCLGAMLYLIATNSCSGWLYVVGAGMGGVVLVAALLSRWNVRGVEAVVRHAPVVATAGEPFECSLEVRNKGHLARHLLEVEDRFAGDTGRAASDIVVYPRTFEVAGLPPSAVADAEREDKSESSTLRRGHGGELWGVREYRPGDPARLVAWKRSARGLSVGKLAVVELAQETHPPFVVALNLDEGAPYEVREMVISTGASLLLYGLEEGREVRAYAGPRNPPFPEEATPDSTLTWCAGLRP